MSVIDIILGALILLGLVRGFIKGFFVEIASLIALVAGIYGAIHFSNFAADFLIEKVDWDEKTIHIAALIITFVVIILVVGLAGKALTKLADFAALGIVNKLLGGFFGGLKIAFVLSALLIVFDRMNHSMSFASDEELEDSVLYQPVKSLVPMILPNILNAEEEENPNNLSSINI